MQFEVVAAPAAAAAASTKNIARVVHHCVCVGQRPPQEQSTASLTTKLREISRSGFEQSTDRLTRIKIMGMTVKQFSEFN